MKLFGTVLIIFVLQASSCNREEPVIIKNNEGIITSKPSAWQTPISDNNKDAIAARNSIRYKSTVVIGSIENGKNGITSIDVTNGEKLWTWQDNFDNYTLDIVDSYTYDKYLVWDEGRQLYCIDMATGTTVWKRRYDTDEVPYIRWVDGLGEAFFIYADYSPYLPYITGFVKIYKTNVTSGPSLQVMAEITSENDETLHSTGQLGIFTNDIGDTLVFSDSNDSSPFIGFANLYNVTKKEWVYYKKETGIPSNGIAKPKLHDGIVYNAMNPYIVAIDLMSGEVVWQRKFEDIAQFYNSGFILVPEKT